MIDVKKVEDFEKLTASLDSIATAIQNMPTPTPTSIILDNTENIVGKWFNQNLYSRVITRENPLSISSNQWAVFASDFETDLHMKFCFVISSDDYTYYGYMAGSFNSNGELELLNSRNTSVTVQTVITFYVKDGENE